MRKSGVSDESDADAMGHVCNKSCVSGSLNLEKDTTHGQTGRLHRSRPLSEARGKAERGSRPTRPIRATGRHPRSILAKMSRVSGVSERMLRGCYEETAPVEFKLN